MIRVRIWKDGHYPEQPWAWAVMDTSQLPGQALTGGTASSWDGALAAGLAGHQWVTLAKRAERATRWRNW